MQQINIHPKVKLEDESLSEDAQKAYCLANSMIPELNKFIDKKEELESQIMEPKEKISELEEQIDDKIEQKNSEEESLEKIHSELQDKKDRLRFVLKEPSRTPVLKWFWFLFNGKKWRKKYNSLKEEINSEKLNYLYHKNEILMLEEVIDDLKNKLEAKKEEVEELSHGIEDLPEVPKVITAIGEINLSFFPIKVSNDKGDKSATEYSIIDQNSPIKQFELPKMDIDQDSLKSKINQLELSQTDEILIQPHKQEKDKWGRNWDRLIGKEREYYNSIQKLQSILREFRTEQCQLPLMETDNPMSTILQNAIDNLDQYSKIRAKHDVQENFREIKKDKERISSFITDNLENLKILTQQINKEKLNKKYEQLYNNRKYAASYLKNSLEEFAHHSSISNNHYFCPKCNLQPEYIREKFGFEITNITDFNNLSTEELKDMCYQYFNEKLNNESNLNEQAEEDLNDYWKNIFNHLTEIEHEINKIGDKISDTTMELEELSLKRQRYKKTQKYKKIIFHLLKNPFKEFAPENIEIDAQKEFSLERLKNLPTSPEENTKLNYNLHNRNWKCPRCKNEFEHSEAQLGEKNKFEHDLKRPILNTLWNAENTKSKMDELEQDFTDKFETIISKETEAVQSNIKQFITNSEKLKDNIQHKRDKFSENIEKIKSRLKEIIDTQEDTEFGDIDEITDHLKAELEQVPEVIENIEANKDNFSEIPDYIQPKTKYIYSQKFEEAVNELKHPEQIEE